jgi:hypothetical protein
MKIWINKISIILLVLLFFISTTGFTLYVHICSCIGSTKHALYNELIKSKPVCCCEKYEKLNTTNPETTTNIGNSECCQNKHLLIKSTTYSLPVVFKLSKDQNFTLLPFYIPTNPLFLIENKGICENIGSLYFPPPLLYGKSLIISNNQFKIPLSV